MYITLSGDIKIIKKMKWKKNLKMSNKLLMCSNIQFVIFSYHIMCVCLINKGKEVVVYI